jgi:hypothetical protein
MLEVLEDPEYDAAAVAPGKGRHALITEGSPQALIIYYALERGNSVGQATVILNEGYRARNGLGAISYGAVDRFVRESSVIHSARQQTKKSGKDDENTVWAGARLDYCSRLLDMLALGRLSPAERAARGSSWPPLYPDGIAFWDEKHKKVKLGHTSKIEYRIRRNADGRPASEADGGVLPPAMPNTTMKFPGEARGLFGVAMVRNADGSYTGKRSVPFDYTLCKIVSFKDYDDAALPRWSVCASSRVPRPAP